MNKKMVKQATFTKEMNGDEWLAICGGSGLNNVEIDLLYQFSTLTGASVVATRAAVEAGFFPKECWVGISGRKIYPKVYILFAASGSDLHMMGIRNKDCIVIAINNDPLSKILKIADIGILSRAEEVLNKLIDILKYNNKKETVSLEGIISICKEFKIQ